MHLIIFQYANEYKGYRTSEDQGMQGSRGAGVKWYRGCSGSRVQEVQGCRRSSCAGVQDT